MTIHVCRRPFRWCPLLISTKKNDILQTIVVVSVQLWVVTLIVFKAKDMNAGYLSFYLHQIWLRTFLWVLLLMSVQVQYWHDLVSKTQLISRNLSLLVKVCMLVIFVISVNIRGRLLCLQCCCMPWVRQFSIGKLYIRLRKYFIGCRLSKW